MPLTLKKHTWTLGGQIGQGGFGQVYAARSDAGMNGVVKLILKKPGAERELLFVGLAGIRNVVPVVDDGETKDHWVIAMPRAERSLRDLLEVHGGALSLEEARIPLLDIADTLTDMDGKVVHRDLKPENVLLLDGKWCLADFGISRYAEATTAAQTLKYALSQPYAASERWRFERATSSTDVYSLGVIAHEMLMGRQPFTGPDYRDQHLHHPPEPLSMVSAPLRALVSECLTKAPEARPSAAQFATRLRRSAGVSLSGGLADLSEANVRDVQARADAARVQSQAETRAERLARLVGAAKESHRHVSEEVLNSIHGVAPTARVERLRNGGWRLHMRNATLHFGDFHDNPSQSWGGWESPAFEVVAFTSIAVSFPPDQYGYEGRSHSLWFCDARQAGSFAWFETAFHLSAFARQRARLVPFTLNPGLEAAKALWAGMAEYDMAWPFERLTLGELEVFVGRWAGWLASAASQRLTYPSRMPEKLAEGSWRRT